MGETVTKTLDSRRATLVSLLTFDRPIEEIRAALGQYEWDCPEPLVSLRREHVLIILERFLSGDLAADAVEAWADLVEFRDDIEFPDDQLLDSIFVLANPAINGALDNESARRLVSELSD